MKPTRPVQPPGDGRGPRAQGLRFINSYNDNSDVYEVYLNQPTKGGPWGDVILSAGALGSPQILMLSGIGPHEHLKKLNISPLINTTEVGKGMQDNPSLAFGLNISQALQKQPPAGAQIVGIANDFRFIIGSLTVPMSLNTTIKIISAKVTDPLSRGELRLNSTDPRQNPSVKFNYFEKKSDLDECVQMAHLIERSARTESIERFLGRTQSGFVDGGASTEEELREYCKKNVSTIGHYHGGCLVGSVVDGDYKVFGVEGLRVLDGSTFLDSPGTNPMATLMMLGRYQGLKMLRERHGDK
ncbi:Glucose-methanol-choline oxidoreductase [Cinnamomum micranthum f. kanehirae]|uniref:Glucose-methanol-choline oxidoreductase n=1 Tax=Cinnamomum micranthum f. kanehirae TaxID=337451 RepID=A0A3S3QNZ6_9MAGN|nr:Glucose-methanol-choline oxidoreductase [Cinnamomum micranthum f. kanehirae]